MESQSPVESESKPQAWSPTHRVAFRFCFVYFGLCCLTTQTLYGFTPIPNVDLPDPASVWPIRQAVIWVAVHIFKVTTPIVYKDSGSGDKTFDWVLTFCVLVIALVATPIWSFVDRERHNYATLDKWFRVFIRFALAGQLFGYGMDKFVPLQMPFPTLTRLLEPYGNFSPMGVLWSSVGASRGYEMFAGFAELLGGIFLVMPRTTLLGALICLADMSQVFILNMTYDVPVKLFSFHLILMSLLLIVPYARGLMDFFLLNHTAQPWSEPRLFASPRVNRMAVGTQILFGVLLVALNAYGGWSVWGTYGGGRPKSPLYGIWDVNALSIDGQDRPLLVTEKDRWRRVIFDFVDRMSLQRMDDSVMNYGATINMNDRTLALTQFGTKDGRGSMTFVREPSDQLSLDGEIEGQKVHMQLRRKDPNKFLLVSRGFHWVQEYPFNR